MFKYFRRPFKKNLYLFSFCFKALNIQAGRTCVMHLVPREKLPEPNTGNFQIISNYLLVQKDKEAFIVTGLLALIIELFSYFENFQTI